MRTQVSTLINRSIETVFDCVTSVTFIERLTTNFWAGPNSTTSEMHQISEGAMGLGTKFLQSNELKGHSLEATVEVIAYKRPRIFTLKVTRGSNITKIKWLFKSTSDATVVTFMLESMRQSQLSRVLGFLAFVISPNSSTRSVEYMQKLKKYIEDHC